MVPMQVSVSIVPSFFKKYNIKESSVESIYITEGESVINRNIRERFDSMGYGVNKYARVNGLEQSTLSRVLDGKLTGTRESVRGNTRKVIATLKRDGIWIGRLPWEEREHE